MNHQPQGISQERWSSFSLFEQMANIGSEVGRAIKWKEKNNQAYSQLSFYRSLELLDLTINDQKHRSHLKEITRLRECLVDYFAGNNIYGSSPDNWNRYFYPFNFAARSSF